ncbi:MAG: PRC-barrel domain-containing protein [Burkholderiales bacterium]
MTLFVVTLSLSLLVLSPQRGFSQAVALVKVDMSVVDKGYRVSKIMGTTVTNDKNEKIGSLDDLVIGSDQSLYAVLQVGGFLGMGGHLVVVPYNSLKIDQNGKKIELPGASKEALQRLAEFKYTS